MASEVTKFPAGQSKPELKSGGGVSAIVPQDAEQAYRMAQLISKSGLAPRDMQTPEKVVTAIFAGLEVGLKPMQAVQSIAVVNGRPTIWGDAAIGLVMGSGTLEDINEFFEGQGDNRVAVCRAKRLGMSSPLERRFSVADAKKAGLWGKTGPWQQYPDRMLQMRARGWCLRDGFADVLKGLAVAEEVRDYARPIHVQESQPLNAAALLEQAGDVAEERNLQITDAREHAYDAETGEVDTGEPESASPDTETMARFSGFLQEANAKITAPESVITLNNLEKSDDMKALAEVWPDKAAELVSMIEQKRENMRKAAKSR